MGAICEFEVKGVHIPTGNERNMALNTPTGSSHFYNVYLKTGWCLGGPDTQTATDPTSVDGCWAACLIDYADSLVAVDYWPKNDLRGYFKCFCQTACDSRSTQHMDSNNPVELALRVGWESDLILPLPDLTYLDGGEDL